MLISFLGCHRRGLRHPELQAYDAYSLHIPDAVVYNRLDHDDRNPIFSENSIIFHIFFLKDKYFLENK